MKNRLFLGILFALSLSAVSCMSARFEVLPAHTEETLTVTNTHADKTTEITETKFVSDMDKGAVKLAMYQAKMAALAANPCGSWNPAFGCQTFPINGGYVDGVAGTNYVGTTGGGQRVSTRPPSGSTGPVAQSAGQNVVTTWH